MAANRTRPESTAGDHGACTPRVREIASCVLLEVDRARDGGTWRRQVVGYGATCRRFATGYSVRHVAAPTDSGWRNQRGRPFAPGHLAWLGCPRAEMSTSM